MKNGNKINIHERISKLETKVDFGFGEIEKKLDCIENNHLSTIYKRLDWQKNWLIGVLITLIFTLMGVILNLLK